ncbi:MAG: 50S ribosomal protein L18 [Candidatus Omnitrophica bacterium]|nr:50S ribosomal protein L18 [Candidatus Omnitrophota bacterium]
MRGQRRRKRHWTIKARIIGTGDRPRLVVFRSLKHIYASLVNDEPVPNQVLTTVSSLSPEFKEKKESGLTGGNKAGASLVGLLIAEKAKEIGVEKVIFDRSTYRYAGRVKSLAEGARKGGLKF